MAVASSAVAVLATLLSPTAFYPATPPNMCAASIHGCCFERHADWCVLLPQGGGMYLSSITHATMQGCVLCAARSA